MTTHSSAYTGDVTLNGDEQTPVKIVDPENVHVKTGAVDGNLKVVNAEYVFTNTPAGGTVEPDSIETEISGSLEDAYLETDGVTGDAVIVGAEDVFIEHDAVSGELQIVGDEQRFHDNSDTSPAPRAQYDDEVTGWKRSLNVKDPQTGIAVIGSRNEARVIDSTHDFDVYVTGWNNNVRINGNGNTVTLHLIGSENTVTVSAYTEVNLATESGIDNVVQEDDFPVDDLIETTKSEAYKGNLFGRSKVTFQKPAMDEDYCPGCGANATAIIERHQEDAFFLFGHPIHKYETGSGSYECEECSANAQPNVELSEDERKDLFQ